MERKLELASCEVIRLLCRLHATGCLNDLSDERCALLERELLHFTVAVQDKERTTTLQNVKWSSNS